jgi:proliferating cell nuclear antigen
MMSHQHPNNNKEYIFRCKTTDAYIFKILIELLHNNIKTACFELTPRHITLRMMDSNRRTLIDLILYAENFNMYFFSPSIDSQNINIGINLNHFYKMLKSIKKKDTLVLFITDDKMSDLGIQIIPKDFSRVTTSYVKIQNIQNLEIALPEGYDRSILVSSNEFSKMCKDMFSMSNTITITTKKYSIGFMCNVGSVYSREVMLGDTETDGGGDLGIEDNYDTEQLSRINKISGLFSSMNINCGANTPFLISTKVGILGKIGIYIKSRRQIEDEIQADT